MEKRVEALINIGASESMAAIANTPDLMGI
jgi:hypothetical protein